MGSILDRLNSWKDIATFFDRDVRTVRRWEETRGLPVHRMPGGGRSGVYAYVSELERWMREAPAEGQADTTVGDSAEVAGEVSDANPGWPAAEELSALVDNKTILTGEAERPAEAEVEPDEVQTAATATRGRTIRQRWGKVAIALGLAFAAVLTIYLVQWGSQSHAAVDPQQKPGRPSSNAEAQELYLKGLFLWNQRTEQSLTDAIDLFTQAIVHDPHFAAAYAGLADSYLLLRQYGKMTDQEAFPRALAAIQQALKLDDLSPQAHRSYAFVLNFWMWDFAKAEPEFKRSLQLNADDAQTHSWYATSLFSQGRYADAMQQIDEARALQPDSITILANRGLLLGAVDLPAAIQYLQELERINPAFANIPLYLAGEELVEGKDKEFLEESRKAAALEKDADELRLINDAEKELAVHGRTGMLQVLAAGYAKRVDGGAQGAMVAAGYYERAGDSAAALHYLGVAYERRESAFLSISHDPAFQALRGTREFEELVTKRNTPLPLTDALRIAAGVSGKTMASARPAPAAH